MAKAGPLFSVATFEGLRRLRLLRGTGLNADLGALSDLLIRTDPDAAGLDLRGAAALDEYLGADVQCEPPTLFYRACVYEVLVRANPSWARAVTLGRQRFYDLLSRDEQQCLRAANLTASPPADEVIEWWDRLSRYIRTSGDASKHDQGRAGERLTMQYERQRLATLGIAEEPRWIAIEDNTAGYDVRSFELVNGVLTALLIEVKSTTASPLRFFVTRNEWKTASQYGSTYRFHVWDMAAAPPRLHQRTVAQIAPHIPEDRQKGEWTTAAIPLAAQ